MKNEADSKVCVTMTVATQITVDEVWRLNPGVDIWSPHADLFHTNADVVAVLRSTGKPMACAPLSPLALEGVSGSGRRIMHVDLPQPKCLARPLMGRWDGVPWEQQHSSFLPVGIDAHGIAGLAVVAAGGECGPSQRG